MYWKNPYIILTFLFSLSFQWAQTEDWKRVYLATYPRSGNHWLRHLIEEATHVATSSVYIDADADDTKHLETAFAWGGYAAPKGYAGDCRYPTNQDIVIIKTHYPSFSAVPFDLQPSVKTIRIVRHPIDSMWSFYILGKSQPDAPRIPQDFLLKLVNAWRTFQEYWDKQENVITIRYEDLYNDTFGTLKKVLSEIGYQVKDQDIQRAIAKNPRRGALYKYKDTFNKEDANLVESRLSDLMQKYHYSY